MGGEASVTNRHKTIQRALSWVIVLGCGAFAAEAVYYLWPSSPLQGIQVTPPEPQGEATIVGEQLPGQLVPPQTDVLALMPLPCEGCEENVPTWNELVAAGINVLGVAQGIEADKELLKEHTNAAFPIELYNKQSFWDRFGDKGAFSVTLVLNDEHRVTWAKIGRVWDSEKIGEQVHLASTEGR